MKNTLRQQLSTFIKYENGYYDNNIQLFGGRYVPEILQNSLCELEKAFEQVLDDEEFYQEFLYHLKHLVGRPSPLIFAENLTKKYGGAKIYLKNEGANHTGSHKINNSLFQVLLAKKMGKTRIIAETGAGQHGVATAVACAKFGLPLTVYMGAKDVAKQYSNVFFMKQLGAKVVAVTEGEQKLTEAVDAAMTDYITNPDSFYIIGSALGPAPYPQIVRTAHHVISKESIKQIQEAENILPNVVVAVTGGGSNATGAFESYLDQPSVILCGVEAGGNQDGHCTRLANGEAITGVFQGFRSKFLANIKGSIKQSHSVAVGINYAGLSPMLVSLEEMGRLKSVSITDAEALDAFKEMATNEGILGALESCHAVAFALKLAPTIGKDKIILVNVSGRADNYIFNIAKVLDDQEFSDFCHQY